ncbi:MAG: glutamyl-tRNA amidotransferase [Candidatus Marinimicrobia bacterium]|mgnify:FL=1|nr:glutamyl-tRNA amidotransferase [Candidatus Neomarinimicrobiota bacterium]|tara:strand:- start:2130 stop:2576 length:447 start_codon:yes stop_codon:yes gene_type:complete
MALINQLQTAMQIALKCSENDRVRTLRTLIAKLKDKSIEKGGPLNDEEEIKILQTASKQRKEAAEMFTKGNRIELAEAELNELSIIKEYLPEELSTEDLKEIIDTIINETGAESIKDIGKVMSKVMKISSGKSDGSVVQSLVKKRLSD